MIMKNRLTNDIPMKGRESRGGDRMSDEALKYAAAVENYIIDHPVHALAAAVLLGLTLAWWIKRR
jgi:ElaB/YqjD/DUF883 family membrane-anchored ribosome-binding protein